MALLLLGIFAGCSGKEPAGEYTLRAAVTTHIFDWSPLDYDNAQEQQLMRCLTTPRWESVIADTKTGAYQWVFLGAESLEDVTEACPQDLSKYGGASVFEIKLRKELCWEDGKSITADTYIYSMDYLVRSTRQFREGMAALAGAKEYSSTEDVFEETVGFYAVDDWTLRYVCQEKTTKQELMIALAEPFLVEPVLHESDLHSYGTSRATTLSCGPYRLTQAENNEFVLVQNERYWEYRKEDGRLVSTTSFQVDGKNLPQYQTTTIHITANMTEEAARQAYQEGRIDFWNAGETDSAAHLTSQNLYSKQESFTLRLFFNTDASVLQDLDLAGNKNSIVLSNESFRKAVSLAIDRAQWVTATEGYTPALGLVNALSYSDDTTHYRETAAGMKAICGLYGVSLPEDATLAQVKDAYDALTGYDLAQAQRLMRESCQELVAEKLYREGAPIHIRIAWKNGKITEADRAQAAILEQQLNAAMEGSGFGKLTLEPVNGGENRYSAVANGRYAVGLGAWGGNLFDPYAALALYCDSDCHEGGCWDPKKEKLTLTVAGKEYKKAWSWWTQNLCDGGELATLEPETRLALLATLEQKLLEKYYTIPLAGTADCFLLSEKVSCYTDDYTLFGGFGGLRLLQYKYNDAQWQAHLESPEK